MLFFGLGGHTSVLYTFTYTHTHKNGQEDGRQQRLTVGEEEEANEKREKKEGWRAVRWKDMEEEMQKGCGGVCVCVCTRLCVLCVCAVPERNGEMSDGSLARGSKKTEGS